MRRRERSEVSSDIVLPIDFLSPLWAGCFAFFLLIKCQSLDLMSFFLRKKEHRN